MEPGVAIVGFLGVFGVPSIVVPQVRRMFTFSVPVCSLAIRLITIVLVPSVPENQG